MKKSRRLLSLVAAVVAACVVAACSESTSEPDTSRPGPGPGPDGPGGSGGPGGPGGPGSPGGSGGSGGSGGPTTVTLANGAVTLTIPEGALPANVTIGATSTSGPESPRTIAGTVYRLSPEGTHLGAPAQLSIRYQPSAVPRGVPQSALALFRVEGGAWTELTSSVTDQTNRRVTSSITDLGVFGILRPGAARIELTPSSSILIIGRARQFAATPLTSLGDTLSGVPVSWFSADTFVAKVDSKGIVTGVAFGTTTITASADSQTATSAVNVVPWGYDDMVAAFDSTPGILARFGREPGGRQIQPSGQLTSCVPAYTVLDTLENAIRFDWPAFAAYANPPCGISAAVIYIGRVFNPPLSTAEGLWLRAVFKYDTNWNIIEPPLPSGIKKFLGNASAFGLQLTGAVGNGHLHWLGTGVGPAAGGITPACSVPFPEGRKVVLVMGTDANGNAELWLDGQLMCSGTFSGTIIDLLRLGGQINCQSDPCLASGPPENPWSEYWYEFYLSRTRPPTN